MARFTRTFQVAQVEVPECLEPVYANHIVVRYSSTRFLLDFAQVLPGVRTHRVRARISLTPHDTLLLSETLADQRSPLVDDEPGYEAWPGRRLPGAENGELGATGAEVSSGDRPLEVERRSGRPLQRSAKPVLYSPPDLPTLACNFVVALTCQGEVILDFAHLAPSAFEFRVAARLILTPACLNRLCDTLEQGLSDYAARFGPPCEPDDEDCIGNLRSPSVWGLSVPFAQN